MEPQIHQLQILLESADLQIPTRVLTLDPNHTLYHLKLSLFPPKTLNLSSIFFTFNGRLLPDSTTVKNFRITPFSTLTLHHRLRGGGGDGGATGAESRDCYLNMYAVKKPDKVDPNEQRLSKWLNCALSNEPLKHPVVIDFLGNLFNKQVLVEALLGKKLPKAFCHVKGLKGMILVELSMIPGLESERGDVIGGTRFQCPITGLEFNGKYKFFALRSCGHVLSAKALKEVKSSACLVCHKEFLENDKIVINGSEEEVEKLREMMEEKAKLKDRKTKKVKNVEVSVNGEEGVCLDLDLDSSRLSGKKHGLVDVKVVDKVEGNGKVVDGGELRKGVSNGSSHGLAKRFKAADNAPTNATKEVYASIFTSSKKSNFKETYSCRSLPLGRN